MALDIFIFDTNIVSALMSRQHIALEQKMRHYRQANLILPQAVVYEIERGLEYKNATRQIRQFRAEFLPLFQVIAVIYEDWQSASRLWALARRSGWQLSDVDLLIGAMTIRLGGVLITDDQDFEPLPIQTANWLYDE